MIKSQIRPMKRVPSLVDLSLWCRDYMHYGAYPCPFLRRFAIGFYQIGQGYDWAKTASEYESYAAAAIHFIMVLEELNISLEDFISLEYKKFVMTQIDHKSMLYHLSITQAHLIYKTNETHVQRRNRYDSRVLGKHLSLVIRDLLAYIPFVDREPALLEAQIIMCGTL